MGSSMRCLSCNTIMTDYEATRKNIFTGEFIDLCNHCFASVSEYLHTIERDDLAHEDDLTPHCGQDSYEDIDTDQDEW